VKLLRECAKKGWWDVARLVVGRLCTVSYTDHSG
jgi:hypothetical protein